MWSDTKELVDNGVISPGRLYRHMSTVGTRWESYCKPDHIFPKSEFRQSVYSLRALDKLHGLYSDLPGATISPRLLTSGIPLGEAKWAQFSERDSSIGIKRRSVAFACIAMCETGTSDLDPDSLEHVMAISSGNSLFITSNLVQDPAQRTQGSGVKRVVGNIGRAGLALLVSRLDPKLPVENPDSWRLINHTSFDGKLENCFPNTSLHLGFSGYEFPLAGDNHGGRFTEAFFIEAVVSAHDRGRWIADLDVLRALDSPLFHVLLTKACCKQKPSPATPSFYLTSIDQWEESLDRRGQYAVVRAHQNWQARLAASAISMNLGFQRLVFAGDPCWKCGPKMLKSGRWEPETGDDDSATSAVFIL